VFTSALVANDLASVIDTHAAFWCLSERGSVIDLSVSVTRRALPVDRSTYRYPGSVLPPCQVVDNLHLGVPIGVGATRTYATRCLHHNAAWASAASFLLLARST
jgi:hypothetical protein